MFYTTGLIKNQGHIVCFYVKASLSICLSVSFSFFLPLSFSACNFNLRLTTFSLFLQEIHLMFAW